MQKKSTFYIELTLVYKEEFILQREAVLREKEIKKWKSKTKIQDLIQQKIAQLVQSIPILSGGSGVRTPHRPQS